MRNLVVAIGFVIAFVVAEPAAYFIGIDEAKALYSGQSLKSEEKMVLTGAVVLALSPLLVLLGLGRKEETEAVAASLSSPIVISPVFNNEPVF